MIQQIICNNCQNSSLFKIQFKVIANHNQCDKCHHSEFDEKTFFFCDMNCFVEWSIHSNIYQDGIPCWSCRDTGYTFGFEQNGTCKLCNGTKKLKI